MPRGLRKGTCYVHTNNMHLKDKMPTLDLNVRQTNLEVPGVLLPLSLQCPVQILECLVFLLSFYRCYTWPERSLIPKPAPHCGETSHK